MLYALCNGNNAETARKFNMLHQNSPKISRIFVHRMMKRLRRTGSFHSSPGPDRNRIYTEDQEEDIIAFFLNNPQTSIRATNEALGLSRMTISSVLNRHNWHPFCVHRLQSLHPLDFGRQVEIYNWLLINQEIDPNFVMNILWIEEYLFSEDGDLEDSSRTRHATILHAECPGTGHFNRMTMHLVFAVVPRKVCYRSHFPC